jgi:hypothetical protein
LTAHSHLYRGEAPPGTNVMHLYRVSRLIQMLHHICIGCFVSVQYPVQTRIMNRHKCRFSNSETISSCASSVTCQIGYVSLPLIFPFFSRHPLSTQPGTFSHPLSAQLAPRPWPRDAGTPRSGMAAQAGCGDTYMLASLRPLSFLAMAARDVTPSLSNLDLILFLFRRCLS